jgi:hypothetical protein
MSLGVDSAWEGFECTKHHSKIQTITQYNRKRIQKSKNSKCPSIVTHEDNQLHSQQWITCGMHGIYLNRKMLGHFHSTIWIAAYS